ncbi:MAG: class I SAM-dependent methyltransferase [Clostridiales bacterium]|nr:class I SAM-dependent methyltransferase [Candidatus Cacconaster stercorequi]
MMYEWKTEHIRFMRDAAAYGNYHQKLAEKLLPHLKQGGRICDAGCGMGYLTQALLPYFSEVTACDISAKALDELRYRAGGESNLRTICGDIADNPPTVPYDGMVFCLFGAPGLVLRVAKQQCSGVVCVICRGSLRHRFSIGEEVLHTDGVGNLEQLLKKNVIPFSREEFTPEFGQPFRTRQEAVAFFRLYNCGDASPTEEDVAAQLTETGRTDFPFYLPQKKDLALLCFDSRDIP